MTTLTAREIERTRSDARERKAWEDWATRLLRELDGEPLTYRMTEARKRLANLVRRS